MEALFHHALVFVKEPVNHKICSDSQIYFPVYSAICNAMLCYAVLCMLCSANYGRFDKEPSRLHGQDNDVRCLAICTEQKIKCLPFYRLIYIYIYIYIFIYTYHFVRKFLSV